MQFKLLFILAGICISDSFAAIAQQQAPVDKNIAVFNILKYAKAIEKPEDKALILLKPEVQMGNDVLTCDSAYFTLGKKFEAFGHVKMRQPENGKMSNKEYLSVDIIENSAYFKNSMVSR